jgi:hypothetical protein
LLQKGCQDKKKAILATGNFLVLVNVTFINTKREAYPKIHASQTFFHPPEIPSAKSRAQPRQGAEGRRRRRRILKSDTRSLTAKDISRWN